MGTFSGLFFVFVAVAVFLIVRPSAATPVLRYDFSQVFTRIRLSCHEGGANLHLRDVRFFVNGSTPITATRVSGYVEGPTGTSILYNITQTTEGPVRCKKLNSGEYSDEVDLVGNPSVGIRSDQIISRPELLDPLIFKPVTLECDIKPGRLKHLYNITWLQLFSSTRFKKLPKSMVNASTFSLHLNSSHLLKRGENTSMYQCSVTVKHGPSGSSNIHQYFGRKIVLYIAARVTITQCLPRIIQANTGGPPLSFNCTAKGNNISFQWSVCQNPIQRSSCASAKNLSMTTTAHMNTTPHSYNSQCSYSGQIAAGTYHVMCNVLQELGPAFSSRRLSRLSDGVLLVKDGSTKEPSTEKGTQPPTSSSSTSSTASTSSPTTTSGLTIFTDSHITFVIFLVPTTFIAFVGLVLFFCWKWIKEKHANKKKRSDHTLEESNSEQLTINTNDPNSLIEQQKSLVTSSRQTKREKMKVKKEEIKRRENEYEYVALSSSHQNPLDGIAHINPKRQERRKQLKEKMNTSQQAPSAKKSTGLPSVDR